MYRQKKIVATIEARMTSSRLPGKVLKLAEGKAILQHIIERLRRSKYLDEIVVATTTNDTDQSIIELCNEIGCRYYRGSEEDVLVRVLEAAQFVEADLIVEITGDCPFVDWNYVDKLIEMFHEDDYDYYSNNIQRSFPRGFDVQVFPVKVLAEVNQLTQSPIDHEHVSIYIYTHPELYKVGNWVANEQMYHPELEVTLDTEEDYELIKKVFHHLYNNNPSFSAEDVVNYLLENPEVTEDVRKVQRKNPFVEQKEWEERCKKN